MDSARYIVALVVVMALPPGIILWLIIHPFAQHWRRIGPAWTYGLLAAPVLALMAVAFLARRWLLAIEFGTSYPLIALAAVVLVAGATMSLKRRRHLTYGILAGLPELSERRYPGELLTDGLYAKMRHPRYIEMLLWVLAYALFANYLAPYVIFLLSIPALYLVVVLEEQELHKRFGKAYEDYCRRVPRFLPKRKATAP